MAAPAVTSPLFTVEEAAAKPRRRRHYLDVYAREVIYFIRAGARGPIKIGRTNNIARRLEMLRVGNHLELSLLATVDGGESGERRIHRRFEHLRTRGEWFRATPELMKFVRALAKRR